METKRINLATMQHRLSRNEMKMILGGTDPIDGEGGSCPGILSCPTLEEGDTCPDVGSSVGCKCKKDSHGDKTCLAA